MVSLTLDYVNGPLPVRYGFEQHMGYNGLYAMGINSNTLANVNATFNVHTKDQGNIFAVYYKLPTNTRICATIEQRKYHTDATAGYTDYKRTSWWLNASQDIQAHKIWAGYGMADKGTLTQVGGAKASTFGTGGVEFGAKQHVVGYAYTLARGVSLFADVFGVINDKNATYAPQPTLASLKAGGDTKALCIGAFYKF